MGPWLVVRRFEQSHAPRSIGIAPNKVTKKNERKIWNYQYKKYLSRKKDAFKFEINDRGKLAKYKGIMSKGYLPKWTNEIFIVTDRNLTSPPTYKIRDMKDNMINNLEPKLDHLLDETLDQMESLSKFNMSK